MHHQAYLVLRKRPAWCPGRLTSARARQLAFRRLIFASSHSIRPVKLSRHTDLGSYDVFATDDMSNTPQSRTTGFRLRPPATTM